MDLASGYSDSFNYGNGYTPLANNAINNNNLAYNANQNYTNMAGMYNPFAQSGGFGAMTDYYSGLGRDYTTATGGNIFGNASGGGSNPYSYDDSAGLNSSTAPRGGAGDYFNWEMSQLNNKGIGSDAGQSPSQYQNQYPVVDWNKWATQLTAPNGVSNQQANPWGTSAGYPYFDNPATYGGLPAGGYQPMNNPNAQALLGYDPRGGDGAYDPAEAMWSMWHPGQSYPGKTQTPAQYGGPDTNLYGYPGAGSLGTMNAFGGYQPDARAGTGGIGSDTLRDQFAWQLAQSSPWATPGAPANGPYPNLGYNPGMSNYFANPTMQQYDWTKNNATLQQQMQDALKTIDGATGNQPAQPYGGQLPDFWQGVRDWTGMGAPQPTPAARPAEPWLNAS